MFFAFYTFNNFISRSVFIDQLENAFSLQILFFHLLFCSIDSIPPGKRQSQRHTEKRTFIKVNYFSFAILRATNTKMENLNWSRTNGNFRRFVSSLCTWTLKHCRYMRWRYQLFMLYRLLMKKFLNWLKSHKKLFSRSSSSSPRRNVFFLLLFSSSFSRFIFGSKNLSIKLMDCASASSRIRDGDIRIEEKKIKNIVNVNIKWDASYRRADSVETPDACMREWVKQSKRDVVLIINSAAHLGTTLSLWYNNFSYSRSLWFRFVFVARNKKIDIRPSSR